MICLDIWLRIQIKHFVQYLLYGAELGVPAEVQEHHYKEILKLLYIGELIYCIHLPVNIREICDLLVVAKEYNRAPLSN